MAVLSSRAGPPEEKCRPKSISSSLLEVVFLPTLLVSTLAVNLSTIFNSPAKRTDDMGWPFQFKTPTREEKALRRILLDKYARITLLSTVLPVIVFILIRFGLQAYHRLNKSSQSGRPTSPVLKARRANSPWQARIRAIRWWLTGDLHFAGANWGQRDLWVVGSLWTVLLTYYSVAETQGDYLHFTKRLGVIAIGQMPMQYLLAVKYWNPICGLLGTSHEEINRWHRVLGRVVFGCMALHSVLYANYFYHAGTLSTKPFTFVVFMGEIAFFAAGALMTTSMITIRRQSYRVFFVVHVVGAMVVPPTIYLHADHAMPTRAQSMMSIVIVCLDVILRRIFTVKAQSSVSAIPDTSLLQITARLPASRIKAFQSRPAAHVYLNLPPSTRPGSFISMDALQHEAIFNPFTVASVDSATNEITLVARVMNGPLTKHLARLSRVDTEKTALCIDGPYGAAPKHIPRLLSPSIDRIILVAGGVGATFIFPVYHAVLSANPNAKIDLLWAVRNSNDTHWAHEVSGTDIISDPRISIFVTGTDSDPLDPPTDQTPLTSYSPPSSPRLGGFPSIGKSRFDGVDTARRPEFARIVEEIMKEGNEERVAVWVCGPGQMAQELRDSLSAWVVRGRVVEWHNEGFGW